MTSRVKVATLIDVVPTLRQQALAILGASPDGLTVASFAAAAGCSRATASCVLGRMYWAALVDRHLNRIYIYTLRTPKTPSA